MSADYHYLVLFEDGDERETKLPGEYRNAAEACSTALAERAQGKRIGVGRYVEPPPGEKPMGYGGQLLYRPDEKLPGEK